MGLDFGTQSQGLGKTRKVANTGIAKYFHIFIYLPTYGQVKGENNNFQLI